MGRRVSRRRCGEMSDNPTIALPPLYPKQRRALYPPDGQRHAAIEGSTKSGKTGGAMIWQMNQGFSHGGAHAWFSPVKSQARASFYRAVDALPETKIDDHETYRRIRVPQRPVAFYFLSSDTPRRIYGREFESVVVDEASRIDSEQWGTIRTLATPKSAPIRAIGNVRDRSNWHYKQCRRIESGEITDWQYTELHWSDTVDSELTPVTREDVEALRQDLPEHLARSLLENEPQAAASNPFGGRDAIEAVATDTLSTAKPVAYGVDLARVQDFTVIIGLDPDGRPAHVSRFQAPWNATVQRVGRELDAPACVDQTGVGDAVLPRIQDASAGHVEGVKMSSSTKRDLYESLAVAIGKDEIAVPAGQTVSELAAIETHATRSAYRYESGADHDDTVDALALALRAYRNRRLAHPGEYEQAAVRELSSQAGKGW